MSAGLVTSTDYAHPRRPALARLYNRARGLGPAAPLSVPALLQAARAAAGASDFGDDFFRAPLDVLVDSINREAHLHPLGLAIMRGRLVALLENRLRIEALVAARPEIGAIAIRRPLVIAGLQRTGTTLLHRLLCADPGARGLLSWEALRPAPLPGEGERGSFRRRAAARLAARGERLDMVICNAGLMPRSAQANEHGHEVMYAVHCFANFILLGRLLRSGVIPNDVLCRGAAGRRGGAVPRVVIVASEAHRSSTGLDLEHLGALVPYGVKDGLRHYGDSKLASVTLATELARRLFSAAGPSVAVHSLCPGPVDSQIAREAPAALKPLLGPVMRTFFASPEAAAAPVVYLAAAPDVAGETGLYLHRLQRKTAAALAIDPALGRRLFQRLEETLRPFVDWSAP